MDLDTLSKISELEQNVRTIEARITELESQSSDDANMGGDDGFVRPEDVLRDGSDGGSAAPYGTFRVEMTDEVDEVSGNTKYKITNCRFYAKHSVVSLSDVIGSADGTWYLNVPHSNPSNASLSMSSGNNDDNNTSIPLFTIADGEVTQDWRGMPFIPIYA